MVLGWFGLMKGIKKRAEQGLDDVLSPRSWPVRCATGAVPGACWERTGPAVGRVAPKIALCRPLFDIRHPSTTHELEPGTPNSGIG